MIDLNMKHINPEIIPFIEKTLDMELRPGQKKYLIGDPTSLDYEFRGSGKTTAYCIKLALSQGPDLDIARVSSFSDARESGITSPGHDPLWYGKHIFLPMFIKIHGRLEEYGFPVRKLIYSRGNKGGFIIND